MPSFSDFDIIVLKYLNIKGNLTLSKKAAEIMSDKSIINIIREFGKEKVLVEITTYGRKVLSFYNNIQKSKSCKDCNKKC